MTDEIFGRKAPQGEGDAARMQLIGGELFRESDFERDGKGNIKTDAEGRPIVKQSVLREIEQERNTIWDDAEKRGLIKKDKDGYYAVAPNGKRSNLTPHQWVETRTKRFKEWFGDWEAAEKTRAIEKLMPEELSTKEGLDKKAGENVVRGMENGVNAIDGRVVRFVTDCVGKLLRHKGFDYSRIIPDLKKLYDSSVPILFEKEVVQPGHKDHTSNFVGYHHYVNRFLADGKEYYVRFTVQEIKTRKRDFVPNQMHSAHITDVEIYNASRNVISGIIDPATKSTSVKVDAKLQNFFESARNSSKIVDENGFARRPARTFYQSGE